MKISRRRTQRRKPIEARGRYDRTLSPEERLRIQRERLLRSAAAVLASRGFAQSTVREIVARERMSRRTFYTHFRDLHDLLAQLHTQTTDGLFRYVASRVAAQSDPIEQLNAGVTALLSALGSNGDLTRVLLRELRAAGPAYEARQHKVIARFVELVSAGVAAAYAQGVASRPPDETTVFALVSGIEAVALRYVEAGREGDAIEAAPALVQLVVRAFRDPPA